MRAQRYVRAKPGEATTQVEHRNLSNPAPKLRTCLRLREMPDRAWPSALLIRAPVGCRGPGSSSTSTQPSIRCGRHRCGRPSVRTTARFMTTAEDGRCAPRKAASSLHASGEKHKRANGVDHLHPTPAPGAVTRGNPEGTPPWALAPGRAGSSARGFEEIFWLFPSGAEERQRCQRKEQHRKESGGDESCVRRGTDQVQLDADLAGDDQEAEGRRL
jgi:hypothetical protein